MKNGAHDRGRTGDLVLTKDTLCRLSYVGTSNSVVVGRGFEPRKAFAGRFTVCSLWPLGHPTTGKPDLGSLGPEVDNYNRAESAKRQGRLALFGALFLPSLTHYGADDPIRTDDLGITSALLYQLSYVGSTSPPAIPHRRETKENCKVARAVTRTSSAGGCLHQ